MRNMKYYFHYCIIVGSTHTETKEYIEKLEILFISTLFRELGQARADNHGNIDINKIETSLLV